MVSSTPPPALYPRERHGTHFTGGWVGPRAGLDGRKISSPTGFDPEPSSPVAQSLYRLSYPAHGFCRIIFPSTDKNINTVCSPKEFQVLVVKFGTTKNRIIFFLYTKLSCEANVAFIKRLTSTGQILKERVVNNK